MLQEPPFADGPLEQQCAEAHATAAALNDLTQAWHDASSSVPDLLTQLHRANFDLWHLEDRARDVHSGDAAVAAVKREIDAVNQRRNDTVERVDAGLLAVLEGRALPSEQAQLHSETPGQMLDRLSILSLKIFHTALEANRDDADPMHRARNRERLDALQEQQADLAQCLQELWQDVLAGRRRIKLYRQHKMYNDPALNPILYRTLK